MPDAFHRHTGRAAVLSIDNVDTDQIIPSREMKTVGRDGLGEGLFAGWRYTKPGGREPVKEFVLNRPEMAGATVLVARSNFGCGSSREHAVWALKDFGFRVIVAESFGEIFHGNCLRNGLLPVTLSRDEVDRLAARAGGQQISIDLEAQTVTSPVLPEWQGRFEIGAYPKRMLIEGLDPIGLTLMQDAEITAFMSQDRLSRPWVYSAG